MNKELVSKPYHYIDGVKDALDKEQREIVKIVKGNNDKYIQKIQQMDQKVNSVLQDTKALQDQYKKKISEIGQNLESTKKFREHITLKLSNMSDTISSIGHNCDTNHVRLTDHSNTIALKFAEQTVDLKAAAEGFEREIERVQILYRELQQEFLQNLEEKR